MKKLMLFSLLLIGTASVAQKTKTNEKAKESYQPPVEVLGSFENEFPSIKAVWRKSFGGDNKSEQRYVAEFTTQGNRISVFYSLLGEMKVLERTIPLTQIPASITKYLQKTYPTFKITEAVKVRNEDKTFTYEVGMKDKITFYDTVFDIDGNFLTITKKDK